MHNQPTFVITEGKVYYFYKDKTNRVEMTTAEIYTIFSSLRQSDLKVMGIDKSLHPCNMVLKVIPVCPPCTRPYISMDGHIYDDDITLKYNEIIKINKAIEKEKNEAKKKTLTNVLEFHVGTLFDNAKGKARQINGRPLKGIRERINGKSGRIRNNLMGKRVDFCARTVIGADPTLELNEVGFPEEFAANLTIPETVNRLNYEHLMDLIRQGKVNYVIRGDKSYNMKYVGSQKQYEKSPLDRILITSKNQMEVDGKTEDVVSYKWVTVDEWETVNRKPFMIRKTDRVWKSDGSFVEGIEHSVVRHFDLRLGDVVERQLRNGDRVILNRQPTLHKGSMLCPKIKILKGRTLRLPISICSAYNADFDGDMFTLSPTVGCLVGYSFTN
jgi:DNA-directed RNA polymerase beta' subunit